MIGSSPTAQHEPTPHQSRVRLFVDEERKLYTSMGLKYKTVFSCGACLRGTFKALWQGIRYCWCFCRSGDVQQQGGVFVTVNGQCTLRHLEDRPDDHFDPKLLLEAALK
eukprot:gnl/Spiro4/26256_TR13093_c0_g1_i1.p2 gnl/Spiro4/26256_TR13093_c0_g1~~gnl/Spiro4/26256_TR13093_c0_g1_i1.p2  ORF type:complete len:109 (+),score=24.75 gnl/Spiro4/26256_TR13093_c0_g1_i1:300-626(+)